jgi:hypothetical protein
LRAAPKASRPANLHVRTQLRLCNRAEGSRAYSDHTSGVGRAAASRRHTSHAKIRAEMASKLLGHAKVLQTDAMHICSKAPRYGERWPWTRGRPPRRRVIVWITQL